MQIKKMFLFTFLVTFILGSNSVFSQEIVGTIAITKNTFIKNDRILVDFTSNQGTKSLDLPLDLFANKDANGNWNFITGANEITFVYDGKKCQARVNNKRNSKKTLSMVLEDCFDLYVLSTLINKIVNNKYYYGSRDDIHAYISIEPCPTYSVNQVSARLYLRYQGGKCDYSGYANVKLPIEALKTSHFHSNYYKSDGSSVILQDDKNIYSLTLVKDKFNNKSTEEILREYDININKTKTDTADKTNRVNLRSKL